MASMPGRGVPAVVPDLPDLPSPDCWIVGDRTIRQARRAEEQVWRAEANAEIRWQASRRVRSP
jgi:hypothetical protein